MAQLLKFTVAYPKVGIGKAKNQLVTMNNAASWLRYYKTKISAQYKEMLGDWFIPVCDTEPHRIGTLECRIYRPTKQRLDADSLAYEAKWTADFLVERGWFEDDDQFTSVFRPVIIEKDRVETEIEFTVYDSEPKELE